MNNPKIEVRKSKTGKGVFAKERIKKGELLVTFDGKILGWNASWNRYQLHHAIQFEKRKWRLSDGIADKFNHSCEPNCGIKNLFDVVAMRDIKAGEELTWDYEMTEDNETGWFMRCKCGSKSCRKKIGAYRNMPATVRKKYKGYISGWLTNR
jgi:uncharacterized protein